MTDPFATDDMARGYATARPPVHSRVIERARRSLRWTEYANRALDIGCGAGLSTKALQAMAKECIGIEPAISMLKWTAIVAPGASFAAATAEAIPVRDGCIDLITAAGSLDYIDLHLFFPEAARILRPTGTLIVYDFLPGCSFRDNSRLDEWFAAFMQRYPPPPAASPQPPLSPSVLSRLAHAFNTTASENFEIGIDLIPQFYTDYMLSETNVAEAVRNGVPLQEIRTWCEETLAPVWSGRPQEVLFRGYFVCLTKA